MESKGDVGLVSVYYRGDEPKTFKSAGAQLMPSQIDGFFAVVHSDNTITLIPNADVKEITFTPGIAELAT